MKKMTVPNTTPTATPTGPHPVFDAGFLRRLYPKLSDHLAHLFRFGTEGQESLAGAGWTPVAADPSAGAGPRPLVGDDGKINLGCLTDRARKCLAHAREVCLDLGHHLMGTGHLLAGIAREGSGIGGYTLAQFGITAEVIEAYLRLAPGALTAVRDRSASQIVRRTQAVADAMTAAAHEALALAHNHVGTEHLLIGLLRNTKSYAAQLCAMCAGIAQVVEESTLSLLRPESPEMLDVMTAEVIAGPHLTIIEASLGALGNLETSQHPKLAEALVEMVGGLAKFRAAMAEPPAAPARTPTPEPDTLHRRHFGSLWSAIHHLELHGYTITAVWHGNEIKGDNVDAWREILRQEGEVLRQAAEAEGWDSDRLAGAARELAAPTSPYDMG